MPSKNTIKKYAPDSFYHIYNRGVAKQKIYRDDQDYQVFLSLLKTACTPKDDKSSLRGATLFGHERKNNRTRRLSVADNLELNSFNLLPNHYHLQIYQKDPRTIIRFMHSVIGTYVMYFNKRHNRVGHLFQGRYRAVLKNNDAELLHLSRYIHLNALDIGASYESYPYSSYGYYTKDKYANWVKPERILAMLKDYGGVDYKTFVVDYVAQKKYLEKVKKELGEQ